MSEETILVADDDPYIGKILNDRLESLGYRVLLATSGKGVLELLDRHDRASGLRSMSRTTAFTATVIARLIVSGAFRRPGVHPPEVLAREAGVFERILSGLAERGVAYTFDVTEL